jgi:hypothetical protein
MAGVEEGRALMRLAVVKMADMRSGEGGEEGEEEGVSSESTCSVELSARDSRDCGRPRGEIGREIRGEGVN